MLDNNDLKAIGDLMSKGLETLEKGIRSLKRTTKGLRNDLEAILGDLDDRELSLRKRVTRIEKHLHLD